MDTPSYEFGGSLMRTKAAFHAAIAEAWIGGGGTPTLATCDDVLAGWDREVGEAERGWDLTDLDGYDRDAFKSAVEELREKIASGRDDD